LITLNRGMARRFNDVIRRGLGKRICGHDLPVLLLSDADGLRIRVRSDRAAIEFHLPAALDEEQIVAPLEALKACSGCRSEPVSVERAENNQVVTRWNDQGIRQVVSCDAPELKGEFPPLPDRIQGAGEGFLAALRDAVDTADEQSTRYAVDCIRLHGAKGTLDATDTRQALVQSGFKFPFSDDILAPANPVFKSPLFADESDVEVGRTENWFTFRIGPWTVHLAIEKERRFPDVDGCIPELTATKSRMRLSESDAQFLERSLSRLPSDPLGNSAVTVDLNGAIAVRARSQEGMVPTELRLVGSSRSGSQICLSMDRHYLERAVRLGFREVCFVSNEAPAVCRDGRRKYVWGLLSPNGIVKPDDQAVRIESPLSAESQNNESKACATGRQDRPPSESGLRAVTPQESPDGDPVRQALLARDTLRSALQQNRQLLDALKQQRKRTRRGKTAAVPG
jgi:hypothetical protein